MLRSTLSCLVEERGAEVRGLEVHLASLEREREQVARSRSSYEAERKRAVGQIQTLRGRVANLNSQLSQVRAEQESQADDLETIRGRLAAKRAEVAAAEGRVEVTVLKSSTSPLNKEEREINNNISNRTKEILNQ